MYILPYKAYHMLYIYSPVVDIYLIKHWAIDNFHKDSVSLDTYFLEEEVKSNNCEL